MELHLAPPQTLKATGMNPFLKTVLAPFLMVLSISVFVLATVKMSQRVEPFSTWFYSFAWWSYIVFVESFLYRRGGKALLYADPVRFLVRLPLSVTIWLIFEAFNFRLQNWHYLNLPAALPVRWLGYTISFATVLPAIFTTGALLDHLGFFRDIRRTPLSNPERLYGPFLCAGVACGLLPLLWPRFFFPLVWFAFFFLLEPINHRRALPSLLQEWAQGALRRTCLLLLSGTICGFLWESLNYWAGAKWFYTVPFVEFLKIFEMPILGFLGFPLLALECYAMVNSFSISGFPAGDSPPQRRSHGLQWAVATLMFVFDVAVFAGIDRFSVVSFSG